MLAAIRGVGMNFSGGGHFKWNFSKGSFCTDLFPNTLYRKCITPPPSYASGHRHCKRSEGFLLKQHSAGILSFMTHGNCNYVFVFKRALYLCFRTNEPK